MILTIARRTPRHEKQWPTSPFTLIGLTTPLNPKVGVRIHYTDCLHERGVTENSSSCADVRGSSQAFKIFYAAVLDEGAPDPDEQTSWEEERTEDRKEGRGEGERERMSREKLVQELLLSTRYPASFPLVYFSVFTYH